MRLLLPLVLVVVVVVVVAGMRWVVDADLFGDVGMETEADLVNALATTATSFVLSSQASSISCSKSVKLFFGRPGVFITATILPGTCGVVFFQNPPDLLSWEGVF